MHSSAVLSRVEELIEFNDLESSKNPSEQLRWRVAATRALSWSTFVGWLERDAAGSYWLTEAGAEALADLSPDDLNLEVGRRYRASKRDRDAQGWEGFLGWASELVDAVDLDAEERDYKLKAAENWAAAGSACAAGDSDWAERLKQGIRIRESRRLIRSGLVAQPDR